MNPPSVSLCMILCNEEQFLRQCLQSARPYVDEIVVVDTGSTDNGMKIAIDMGGRVEQITWQKDFSLARNHSLQLARGEWVLILDADETVEPMDRELFRSLLAQPQMLGYYLKICNINDQGECGSFATAMRLFRNRPEIRFKYPLHESVLDAVLEYGQKQGMKTATHPMLIKHYGYTSQVMQVKNKLERNQAILKKALVNKNFQNDLFIIYNYAKLLRHPDLQEHEDNKQAEQWLQRAFEQLESVDIKIRHNLPYATDICYQWADFLNQRGDTEKALQVLRQGVMLVEPTCDLLYFKGELAFKSGSLEEAKRDWRQCRESNEVLGSYNLAGADNYLPLCGLAQISFIRGNIKKGRELLEQAITEAGDSSPYPRYQMAYHLIQEQKLKQAKFQYMEISKTWPGEIKAWIFGARLLNNLNLKERACQWLQTAAQLDQNDPDLQKVKEEVEK